MADGQAQTPPQTSGSHASTRERRMSWQALATGIALLWLSFLGSLLLSAAQAAGRAVGVPLPQLLHTAFAWAHQQSLYNQIGLAILGGSMSVCVIWFTVWAWGARAAAQLEAEQQAIKKEDWRFGERIEPLVKQGKEIEEGVQKVSAQIDAAVATRYTIAPVRDLNGVSGFNLGRPSAATFPIMRNRSLARLPWRGGLCGPYRTAARLHLTCWGSWWWAMQTRARRDWR